MFLFFIVSLCHSAFAGEEEFDIHGAVRELTTDENNWTYFGCGFGDFGHTIHVRIWGDESQYHVYYTLDHSQPNVNSSVLDGSEIFLDGGTMQYARFGILGSGPEQKILVSVASKVRPIHPNLAMFVITMIWLFFCLNFVITGILQFLFFSKATSSGNYVKAPEQ